MHTLYIEVPGIEARAAYRLVVGVLTHYGFQCPGDRDNYTKQSRGVAQMRIAARHCAGRQEDAARLLATVLPGGSRVAVGAWDVS